MNVTAILTLVLICLAVYFSYKLYKEYGLTFTLFFSAGAIWLVAFLILWIGNIAIRPIRGQAETMVFNIQDLASDAFPDVIDQSPLVVDEDNNGKFMNSSTSPSPSSDAAVVVTPIEETPPAEGDTRWGGSRLPSPGDPYMVYQMDCYNKTGFEGIPSLLVMYGLPRGWSGSLSTGTWGMFMWAVDEDWDVTVRPPGDYSQISFKVKADLAEKLKSDWGGETAVGTAPWPLVAEKYSNGVWNILKPVQCQWPN